MKVTLCYCLMDNHYHLLVETPDGNLSEGMKHLNAVYTQRFNKRHGLVGHLFQGRYKSILVQKESYLLALCRYIVLNPVRAGVSKAPWKWSSYPALAGKDECRGGLCREWVLSQFGADEKEAERRYEEYVREGMACNGTTAFPVKGAVLGDNEYRREIERQLQDVPIDRDVPIGQKTMARPLLGEIFGNTKDRRERNRLVYEASRISNS
ncbi:MAG: transposase [bacterium]|nr:transposase [bacterium]